MSDDAPKSAYELAMERLRAQDRDAGVEERPPLTDEQKREIAEVRGALKAKIAELEILRGKDLAEADGDPEKLALVEDRFRVDRRRAEDDAESRIARIRGD